MFDIKWNPEINGVELGKGFAEKDKITAPRPVFYQELDLLGFDQYWEYPKIETPILWAIGRAYYYQGIRIGTAIGGNLYDAPELKIEFENKNGVRNKIEPVDLERLLSINESAIKLLENEASEFIDSTYHKYHKRADAFAVAYSGGKDSQVILDLVTKTLAVNQYSVIFGDTTMELPCTYEAVKKTEEFYQLRFPCFKIHTAKPQRDAVENWRLFAPPSTTHRWCCTVCKTTPFAEKLFELTGTIKNGRVLVFEGVRASESSKRSAYKRISQNKKYAFQTNAEIILNWNNSEVYLYILANGLYLNEGYLYGLDRVGCILCPYGTIWHEHIKSKLFSKNINRYLDIIRDYNNINIRDEDFMKSGRWKLRSGGRGSKDTLFVEMNNKDSIKFVISSVSTVINTLRILGEILTYEQSDNNYHAVLKLTNANVYEFSIYNIDSSQVIEFYGINSLSPDYSAIKKTIIKSQYCVDCGLCNMICPSSSFSIFSLNSDCSKCGKCLNIGNLGCIRADSLYVTIGDISKMEKIATSRYQTFGLRKEMIDTFFKNTDNWQIRFNLGGKPMLDSMVCWLKDAQFIDVKKANTELSSLLSQYYELNKNLAWEIIWTQLYYGSALVRWYIDKIPLYQGYSADNLVQILLSDDEAPQKTCRNAISSLMNLLKNGIIDNKLSLVQVSTERSPIITKNPNSKSISSAGFLFALHRYCQVNNRYEFNLNELIDRKYPGSPSVIFNLDYEYTKDMLQVLDGSSKGMVTTQFVKNLDNVFMDRTSMPSLISFIFNNL